MRKFLQGLLKGAGADADIFALPEKNYLRALEYYYGNHFFILTRQ